MSTAALSKHLHLARAEQAAGHAFGWGSEDRPAARRRSFAHYALALTASGAAASAALFYAAWDAVSF